MQRCARGTALPALVLGLLAGCSGAPVDAPDAAFDCTQVPPAPVSVTELVRPRARHDLAFDQDGYLIGWDAASALVRTNRQDELEVVASGFDFVEGMDMHPDGTLYVASSEGLVSVLPGGAKVPLAPSISAFGVRVGPDGLVYAAAGSVHRVDPATGQSEVILDPADSGGSWTARTVEWDPAAVQMYVGTFGDQIFVVDVDETLTPTSAPRLFATPSPGTMYMDGMAVDACGNLYVPIYDLNGPRTLYRVTALGQVAVYQDWGSHSTRYGHGLKWGSGLGGWRQDALYLPQPYDDNTVVEVVVGVPGRINRPATPPGPERPNELLGCATAASGGWALPLLVLVVLAGIRSRRGRDQALRSGGRPPSATSSSSNISLK